MKSKILWKYKLKAIEATVMRLIIKTLIFIIITTSYEANSMTIKEDSLCHSYKGLFKISDIKKIRKNVSLITIENSVDHTFYCVVTLKRNLNIKQEKIKIGNSYNMILINYYTDVVNLYSDPHIIFNPIINNKQRVKIKHCNSIFFSPNLDGLYYIPLEKTDSIEHNKDIINAEKTVHEFINAIRKKDWNTFSEKIKIRKFKRSLTRLNYNHIKLFYRTLDEKQKKEINIKKSNLLNLIFRESDFGAEKDSICLKTLWHSDKNFLIKVIWCSKTSKTSHNTCKYSLILFVKKREKYKIVGIDMTTIPFFIGIL